MLLNGSAGWGQVRRCSLAYLPAAGTTVQGRAWPGGRLASRNLARSDLRGSIDTLAEVPSLERAVRASPHHGPNGAWRARWRLGKASCCAMSRTAAGGGPPYRSSTPGAPAGRVPLRISATTVWPTAHGPARGFPTHATDPRQGASTSRLVRGQPSEWPCPAAGTCVSASEGVLQLLFGHGRAALDVALLGLFVELVFSGSLCAAV